MDVSILIAAHDTPTLVNVFLEFAGLLLKMTFPSNKLVEGKALGCRESRFCNDADGNYPFRGSLMCVRGLDMQVSTYQAIPLVDPPIEEGNFFG